LTHVTLTRLPSATPFRRCALQSVLSFPAGPCLASYPQGCHRLFDPCDPSLCVSHPAFGHARGVLGRSVSLPFFHDLLAAAAFWAPGWESQNLLQEISAVAATGRRFALSPGSTCPPGCGSPILVCRSPAALGRYALPDPEDHVAAGVMLVTGPG
jgi:hypothetical protein